MKTLRYDKEYASEAMDVVPSGYIDKSVCGCGLSSLALEKGGNTIIAVPSKELIRNKVSQYPNKRSPNQLLGVYGETKISDINLYVDSVDVIKIMVTYDSLWKVKHLLDTSHLIIDESNKLLSSSGLKSRSKTSSESVDVVTQVFDIAYKYKDTVSFISATPTPLEFMPKWVSEIEQVKMEWSNTVKATPILYERAYPYKALTNEILLPMKKLGSIEVNGRDIKKVIVFVNSLTTIIKSIKESGIEKDEVAIIAGDSIENDLKIKGYNRLQNPADLPKYTFITSSGFEGIDLIDEEAISIVVSNTSKSHQMIDMLTDLKQAISRQRNKKNPNYDKFIYIYNQSIFSKTIEELTEDLNIKFEMLNNAIYLWEVAKKENRRSGFSYTESNGDFVAYTNFNQKTEEYVVNTNLFNADKYFILNIRKQYEKGFDIKGGYERYEDVLKPEVIDSLTYCDLVTLYNNEGNIEKYKYKVEYYNLIMESKRLYNKVWSNFSYAKKMVENYSNEYARIIITVRMAFEINKKYSVKEVKDKLTNIYKEFGLNRNAKATDLQEFMTIKNIRTNSGRFIEIINKKTTIK